MGLLPQMQAFEHRLFRYGTVTRLLSQFLFIYSFLSLYGNNRQYNENYLMAFGRPWKTLYKAIFSEKFLETSRKNYYFMKKTKKSVDFLIIIH
nr:hypothetical protein [Enterococcus faecium]